MEKVDIPVIQLLFWLAVPLLSTGCKTEESVPSDRPLTNIVRNRASTDLSKTLQVIRSQPELATAFSSVSSEQIPDIDFNSQVVLYVLSEPLPSDGYDVNIESVQDYPNYTLVDVVLFAPGQGCAAAQVITSYYQFAKMERPERPVLFRERYATQDCP